jgi:hypothetical protein
MTEEKPKTNKFSKPLELETAGRGKLVFKTLEELQEWFDGEQQAWSWLRRSGQPGAKAWTHFHSAMNDLTQVLPQVRTAVAEGQALGEEHERRLRSALAMCSPLFTSDSMMGKGVLALRDLGGGDARAGAAMAFLVGQQVTNIGEPHVLRGVLDAVVLEAGVSPEAASAAKQAFEEQLASAEGELADLRAEHARLLGEIKGLRESGSSQLDEQKSEHVELVEKHKGQLDEALTKTKEDLGDLKRTYDVELALRAPVTYWSSKRKEHKRLAKRLAWWSGICLLLALGAFAGLVDWMIPSGGEVALGHVAALALMSAPLLWGVRVLIRNLLSNIHLATDAAEREVLIQTYLALTRKGWAKQEELELVLQAIFRPTSTGIVKDDAAPAGLTDFLRDRL